MSLFGRALAGAGAGASALASKYIDEELQANKARLLADLQRTTAGYMRQDEDAFRNDPERVQRDRANKVADIEAEGGVRSKVALAGKLAEAQSPELLAADTNRASVMARAQADTAREAVKASGADTEFLKAQTAIKLADPEVAARIAASRASAASAYASAGHSNAATEGIKLANADKKKLDDLYEKATRILSDPALDPAKRAQDLAAVERQIVMMKSKTGQAAARDPELDTQTVVDEKLNPDGTTTKTTRKEVRRPGAEKPSADDPVKAAMDRARAANQKPAGPDAGPPVTPADRPFDPQRESMSLQQRSQADRRTNAQATSTRAAAALRSGDLSAAQDVLTSPGFDLLDLATKQAIRKAVYGK